MRFPSYFLSLNRNKQSIAIDMAAPEGRDVILELLSEADVLVENFRTGVMEKFGFGYEPKGTVSEARLLLDFGLWPRRITEVTGRL